MLLTRLCALDRRQGWTPRGSLNRLMNMAGEVMRVALPAASRYAAAGTEERGVLQFLAAHLAMTERRRGRRFHGTFFRPAARRRGSGRAAAPSVSAPRSRWQRSATRSN